MHEVIIDGRSTGLTYRTRRAAAVCARDFGFIYPRSRCYVSRVY